MNSIKLDIGCMMNKAFLFSYTLGMFPRKRVAMNIETALPYTLGMFLNI